MNSTTEKKTPFRGEEKRQRVGNPSETPRPDGDRNPGHRKKKSVKNEETSDVKKERHRKEHGGKRKTWDRNQAWIRDLCEDGVEPNPGPCGRCAGGHMKSQCPKRETDRKVDAHKDRSVIRCDKPDTANCPVHSHPKGSKEKAGGGAPKQRESSSANHKAAKRRLASKETYVCKIGVECKIVGHYHYRNVLWEDYNEEEQNERLDPRDYPALDHELHEEVEAAPARRMNVIIEDDEDEDVTTVLASAWLDTAATPDEVTAALQDDNFWGRVPPTPEGVGNAHVVAWLDNLEGDDVEMVDPFWVLPAEAEIINDVASEGSSGIERRWRAAGGGVDPDDLSTGPTEDGADDILEDVVARWRANDGNLDDIIAQRRADGGAPPLERVEPLVVGPAHNRVEVLIPPPPLPVPLRMRPLPVTPKVLPEPPTGAQPVVTDPPLVYTPDHRYANVYVYDKNAIDERTLTIFEGAMKLARRARRFLFFRRNVTTRLTVDERLQRERFLTPLHTHHVRPFWMFSLLFNPEERDPDEENDAFYDMMKVADYKYRSRVKICANVVTRLVALAKTKSVPPLISGELKPNATYIGTLRHIVKEDPLLSLAQQSDSTIFDDSVLCAWNMLVFSWLRQNPGHVTSRVDFQKTGKAGPTGQ